MSQKNVTEMLEILRRWVILRYVIKEMKVKMLEKQFLLQAIRKQM